MEITVTDRFAELAAEKSHLSPEDIRKILKARAKRASKAEARRKRQRNAKNGTINHYKLEIINDMFEEKPRGHAYQDSNGRSYYTLDGTTVRL